MLRAPVFPGTAERIAEQLKGVGVSFCPERLAMGQAVDELTQARVETVRAWRGPIVV